MSECDFTLGLNALFSSIHQLQLKLVADLERDLLNKKINAVS
jgi:hypothetical protein